MYIFSSTTIISSLNTFLDLIQIIIIKYQTIMSIYLRKSHSALTGISFINTIKESYPQYLKNEKFWRKRLEADMCNAKCLLPDCKEWKKLSSYQKYLYCSTNFCDPEVEVNSTSIITNKDTDQEVFTKLCIEKMISVLKVLNEEGIINSIIDNPSTEIITTRFGSTAVQCTTKFKCGLVEQIDLSSLKEDIENTVERLACSGSKSGLKTTSCRVMYTNYKLVSPYNPLNENYLEYTVTTDTKSWMPDASQFSASRLAGMMIEMIEEFDLYLSVIVDGKSSTRVRMYLKDDSNRDVIISKLQSLHTLLNKGGELEIHTCL